MCCPLSQQHRIQLFLSRTSPLSSSPPPLAKFPQTARMTEVLDSWKHQFDEEWENLSQQHAWQAKMSQQEVTKLQVTNGSN